MAAMPTVPMGSRLPKAIGDEAVAQLMKMAHGKELLGLRESSLYFERRNGALKIPRTAIDMNLSRSVLLFAVEVFDDALVGLTNYSMEISARTDAIFDRVASA